MINSKYQEAFHFFRKLPYRIPLKFANSEFCEQYDKHLCSIQELVDKATPKNPILVTHGKVKMTAKEMFEKLGYTYHESNNMILYEISEINYFIFSPNKEITVGDYAIDVATLKAINQQCKELGWI